jgi:hypothetical protein
MLGLLWGDAVGEGAALARCVVGIFVPGTLGVEEPVKFLLVEGSTLLGPIGDSDGVVGAAFVLASLGRLSAVTILVVPWRTITS